jgi:hypothetical protein
MADTVTVRKWEDKPDCPKCGLTSGEGVSLAYQHCQSGRGTECSHLPEGFEHHHVTCNRCDYRWLSNIADDEEAKVGQGVVHDYDASPRCPKCQEQYTPQNKTSDDDEHEFKFCPGKQVPEICRELPANYEHIHIKCNCCKYEWLLHTLDYDEDDEVEESETETPVPARKPPRTARVPEGES